MKFGVWLIVIILVVAFWTEVAGTIVKAGVMACMLLRHAEYSSREGYRDCLYSAENLHIVLGSPLAD